MSQFNCKPCNQLMEWFAVSIAITPLAGIPRIKRRCPLAAGGNPDREHELLAKAAAP
ncbi:hypothetical protein AB4851_09220 [Burkholderia sp. 22PA0099]|uniref:hypothetical protein n=1 Tax=Burkholderia sp. 22PA0099 TaxID=3237372 RepID=UPI0039C444BA